MDLIRAAADDEELEGAVVMTPEVSSPPSYHPVSLKTSIGDKRGLPPTSQATPPTNPLLQLRALLQVVEAQLLAAIDAHANEVRAIDPEQADAFVRGLALAMAKCMGALDRGAQPPPTGGGGAGGRPALCPRGGAGHGGAAAGARAGVMLGGSCVR